MPDLKSLFLYFEKKIFLLTLTVKSYPPETTIVPSNCTHLTAAWCPMRGIKKRPVSTFQTRRVWSRDPVTRLKAEIMLIRRLIIIYIELAIAMHRTVEVCPWRVCNRDPSAVLQTWNWVLILCRHRISLFLKKSRLLYWQSMFENN